MSADAWLQPYRNCRLCPRQCGVDRTAGQRGVCGETATCRLSTACAHHGEEPPISGTRGSGTFFFTGCSCRCFFCQNYQISQEGLGREVTVDDLVAEARGLVGRGVHNLNMVTGDHVWPHVREMVVRLRAQGVDTPLLWNASGYQTVDLVDQVAEFDPIFLPDFKFARGDLAQACMGDARYPELALAALNRMVGHVGYLEPWDMEGRVPARRGVLVRHLVLPGEVENSLEVLRLLRREFGKRLPLSVMSQFRPVPACRRHDRLTRSLTHDEYRRVVDLAEELEFDAAFIQPDFGDPDFMPDFRDEKPFPGRQARPPKGGG